jgi:hypothetical protein
MSDDPGLDFIEHLFHFFGTRDTIQKIGAVVYAGRWSLLAHSAWNRAKADGKITLFPLGSLDHTGPKGYFGPKSYLKNGQSFLERTVEVVVHVVEHPDDYVLSAVQ